MFRRKSMPARLGPSWEAFQAQAARVEAARQALLGCLPVGRVDPAPVPVGLELLADELRAVGRELDAWRVPEVAAAWADCEAAVAESLAAVPGVRVVADGSGELEELLGAVSAVVEPLHAWADAERAWRALRTTRTG